MALPTSPVPPGPARKKPSGIAPQPEKGLPTLPPVPKLTQPKTPEPEQEQDGWTVDPRTGVRYRKLAATDPEAIKAYEKGGKMGLSLDQLRSYTEEADFDADDLNGAAEQFLAHLRVPVSQEELAEARAKRTEKLKKNNE